MSESDQFDGDLHSWLAGFDKTKLFCPILHRFLVSLDGGPKKEIYAVCTSQSGCLGNLENIRDLVFATVVVPPGSTADVQVYRSEGTYCPLKS